MISFKISFSSKPLKEKKAFDVLHVHNKGERWFATMDITAICLVVKGNNKARINS
jgi:hypothetical protein